MSEKTHRYVLLATALMLTSVVSFCQHEADNWYFGYGQGLNFSNGSAEPLLDSNMESFEGCAVMSDSEGNLLFYTNGGGRPPGSGQTTGIIWNREHEVMYDMQGAEGGGSSAMQSSVIVPKPGSPGVYLLFTMEEYEFETGGSIPGQPEGRGLSWFEIDMSLNSGLGGVTVADQRVHVPAYESLAAWQHPNGTDHWVVIADAASTDLLFYPVTSTGIGTPHAFPRSDSATVTGVIHISPDRTQLAVSGYVYRLDAATATTLSDPRQLAAFSDASMAFSANSRYLYTQSWSGMTGQLVQYDTESADLSASIAVVDTFSVFPGGYTLGQFQLGPDGRIYVVRNNIIDEEGYVDAITCANTSDPVIIPNVLEYNSVDALAFGLPNFEEHILANDWVECNSVPVPEHWSEQDPSVLNIQPGTVAGSFDIRLPNADQERTVEVFDGSGQMVMRALADAIGNARIDLTTKADGIYFVRSGGLAGRVVLTR